LFLSTQLADRSRQWRQANDYRQQQNSLVTQVLQTTSALAYDELRNVGQASAPHDDHAALANQCMKGTAR
jgi:hypothetical protein